MNNLFRKPKRSIFKIITIVFAGLLLVLAANYYINYKYSLIIESFFSKFNSCDFTTAKQTISEDNIYLKLKKKTLNKDLNTYFSSVVKDICDSVLDNEDDKSKALLVLNEIKSYDVLNSSLNKVIISLDDTYVPKSDSDYEAILDLGLDNCNSGNFTAAIDFLNKIPDSSKYYSDATKYIDKCINDYKDGLFKEADALVKDDYYTKAINLLSNVDTSIISHINTLNIESLTPYLVYVNLADQITYVYKGSMNKWDTVKSFTCSTGIDTEKTPTGIFDVRERGDWFYSDKYEQGGKYWVQFYGDYLFHSVPYNEDQSEVVDNTLGTPASHGCIRLKTEDAKWIYDNIDSGTKVIIN